MDALDTFTPVETLLSRPQPQKACVTAQELWTACKRLEMRLGKHGRVDVSVGTGRPDGMEVCVGVHPLGVGREYKFFYGSDFTAPFEQARQWIATREVARDTGAMP